MTSLPTLSVRVAFANNPNDSSLTWTEIGPAAAAGPGRLGWVRSLVTKRGRERLLRTQAQFQAGSLSCRLDNRDRRFDPTNTSGPYYPNVEPEKVIQVGATWSGTFYPIWTGYVDDWPQSWPGFSEGETAVAATDYFKSLGIARVLSTGYPQQVIADGATAYWRLNDTPVASGVQTVADATGNGNTGSVLGTVTFGQAGALPANPATSAAFGAGASATGVVQVPAVAANGGSYAAMSAEAWVQVALADLPATVSSVWCQGGIRSSGFGLFVNPFGNVTSGTTVGEGVADGNWHHIVTTLTSGGTVTVYVDGVSTIPGTAFEPATGVGYLGGSTSTPTFPGNVQEVAIYNGVTLTTAQVANHYALATFPAQTTDGYIRQILGYLGLPATRQSIDTGYTYCQADTNNETQTKALDFLQKMEQTEQGQLYVSAAGNLVFENRYHRYIYPNLTPAATLGDGGAAYPTEIPYSMGGVTLNFDRAELFNDIAVTRRNGNLQDVFNPASIDSYGNRAPPGLSDLLMATDADAYGCASWILADTAYPQYRIGQLVIDPRVDARLWPLVLGSDIGTVITVAKHNIPGGGPALSLTVRIEGIEHKIDPPNQWTTTWHVSLTGTLPWLILDDSVTGLLDSGNRWGW